MSAHRVCLHEIAEIGLGFAFKSVDFSKDGTGTRLLRGDNIVQGATRWNRAELWPDDNAPDPRYQLAEDDVVLAMDRPWIEAGLKFARIRAADIPSLLVQRVARLRVKAGNDQRFLAAVIGSRSFSDYILSVQTGTAVPHISGGQIGSYSFEIPRLSIQTGIAEVLGALDDKIAANTSLAQTIVELLEVEIGHRWLGARDEVDDSDLASISELIEFNPSLQRPPEASPVYVDMKKLPESGSGIIDWDSRPAQGGARFSQGDTLLARITPCLQNRKTGFVDFLEPGQVAIGSTEFIVMRSRPHLAKAVSYFVAVSPDFRDFAIRHMVGTSGRQRASASDLALFQVPQPDASWLQDFGARADAQFVFLKSLRDESRILATTRDALLPQLMSGKLRVKDAEKSLAGVL